MINKDYITSTERLSFINSSELKALLFLKQKKQEKFKKKAKLIFYSLVVFTFVFTISQILA